MFDYIKKTKSNFKKEIFKKLFINIPKELLHQKIDRRVEKMFDEDVIDEVKKFLEMKISKELSLIG